MSVLLNSLRARGPRLWPPRSADSKPPATRVDERPAPSWLVRALAPLPPAWRHTLALALYPELAELERRAAALRQAKEGLMAREAALSGTQAELTAARAALGEARAALEGQQRLVEQRLAELTRREQALGTLKTLPRKAIAVGESPRPLREIERLAESLKRFGQQTPVVVRPEGDGYVLVSGFRRLAALSRLNAAHVQARVLPLTEAEAAALYLAENRQIRALAPDEREAAAQAWPALAEALAQDRQDDGVTEELFVEDLVSEVRRYLSEGASWLAALRGVWSEVEPEGRAKVAALLRYVSQVASRIERER